MGPLPRLNNLLPLLHFALRHNEYFPWNNETFYRKEKYELNTNQHCRNMTPLKLVDV
jgi:hypothetical protein